ncbi:hypothetical protein OIU79_023190 [Salix purpurea]|uniref:Uncharacterized protein n=1 Tax=Salix purpurea TaxID=77065 RepID=A0A9Q0WK61_SALPP|nr:hypothetical protein OIU79_023190 [Salix purpurea]
MIFSSDRDINHGNFTNASRISSSDNPHFLCTSSFFSHVDLVTDVSTLIAPTNRLLEGWNPIRATSSISFFKFSRFETIIEGRERISRAIFFSGTPLSRKTSTTRAMVSTVTFRIRGKRLIALMATASDWSEFSR